METNVPQPTDDPRRRRLDSLPPESFALFGQLEDALDSARKLALALELIGLGMCALGSDDGPAILGVAEVLVVRLKDAESARAALRSAWPPPAPPPNHGP